MGRDAGVGGLGSDADREKLGDALGEMVAEDPSLAFCVDQESGQTILRGTAEWHLDAKIAILKHKYLVEAEIGAPQVAYRETISCAVKTDRTHKKHLGPMSQFARVVIQFTPGEPGSGFQFESKIVGGAVPEEFIPSVEMGLESAREHGLLAGFPVIDFKATLIDGAFHDIDSSVIAFKIASEAAFKELREKGAPRLLWPIMKVGVLTPEEYLGDVIGDLNSRRGHILGTEQRGNVQVVTAFVPLAKMFGYIGNLRGMSQGRVQFTMQYDHYEATPGCEPPDDTFPNAVALRA